MASLEWCFLAAEVECNSPRGLQFRRQGGYESSDDNPFMSPLELVKLTALMERTTGAPEVRIGLIDGPVVTQHSGLAGEYLSEIPGNNGATCTRPNSKSGVHGTFVAGILSAKRSSPAPAICTNCTLLIRPIFTEVTSGREHMPSATPLAGC